MHTPEFAARVAELADKYSAPTRQFPDDWDAALLNVYRADLTPVGREGLSGRRLLTAAREGAARCNARLLVTTGDSDTVVPPRASQKVAALLGGVPCTLMQDTGHLPHDERPEELARILLDFILHEG